MPPRPPKILDSGFPTEPADRDRGQACRFASERQAANASSKSTVSVAGLPGRSTSVPTHQAPSALIEDPEDWAAFFWAGSWRPTTLRGWAGSMTLHGLLLLTLGLWDFFAPFAAADPLRQQARRVSQGRSGRADPDRGDEHAAGHAGCAGQFASSARRAPPGADRAAAGASRRDPGSGRQAKPAVGSPTTIRGPVKAMALAWPAWRGSSSVESRSRSATPSSP